MKRSNGEGSVWYSRSQKLWAAEIVLPDGKRKRKRSKRQSVVREWLDKERKAVSGGVWVSSEKAKYGEFLDRYLDEVAVHTLRPTTLASYTHHINDQIRPVLGDMRITSIRPDYLQRLYSNLLKSGLSKTTVRYVHSILRKTLSVALKWGLVVRNVADSVTPPKPDPFEIKPLSVDEVKRLLKVLENDRLYAYYVLICTTGIRRGEALGLQKKNLLLDEGVLLVRNSLSQVQGAGLVLGEPKSKASRRDLALPQFAIDALKKHLAEHPNTSSYVFATGNNTPFLPRNIVRHFKSKLVEAELPAETRLHDLRHSVISWLLASGGISVKDAQGLAGHSQASTTLNIYGHLLPGYSKKAAPKIEGMFEVSE